MKHPTGASVAPEPSGRDESWEDHHLQPRAKKTCISILDEIETCIRNRVDEDCSVSGASSLFVALPELQGQLGKKLADVKSITAQNLDDPLETFIGIAGAHVWTDFCTEALISKGAY